MINSNHVIYISFSWLH